MSLPRRTLTGFKKSAEIQDASGSSASQQMLRPFDASKMTALTDEEFTQICGKVGKENTRKVILELTGQGITKKVALEIFTAQLRNVECNILESLKTSVVNIAEQLPNVSKNSKEIYELMLSIYSETDKVLQKIVKEKPIEEEEDE